MERRAFCLALTASALWTSRSLAQGQTQVWSATQANAALSDPGFVLLDIRSQEEWAETGVARGAWPVSMHRPEFATELQKIISGNPDATIGLICATGGRSQFVLEVLQKNGISNFVDVSEGMLGSKAGPGWIARGLPVATRDEAIAALPADLVR